MIDDLFIPEHLVQLFLTRLRIHSFLCNALHILQNDVTHAHYFFDCVFHRKRRSFKNTRIQMAQHHLFYFLVFLIFRLFMDNQS